MRRNFKTQDRNGNGFSSLLRRRIVTRKSSIYIWILALLTPAAIWCQSDPSTTTPEVTYGGYRIHQSFEAGYRVSDATGNESMFNTLVNTHEGPRLFEQMLSMRSENHQGDLFDDLFLHSMGWGGDPNNYLQMRIGKNHRFDFRASFRRDQDYADFNLLANPLNPTWSTPDRPVGLSPHQFETRRRMSDFNLTLLPQSFLTFRLGFTHNNMTGPSWTSIHEGTDGLLDQPWNTTLNTWRAGLDVKVAPRTVLSYDHVLNYYKGDSAQSLQWPTAADAL
jgi:hypothetical protein